MECQPAVVEQARDQPFQRGTLVGCGEPSCGTEREARKMPPKIEPNQDPRAFQPVRRRDCHVRLHASGSVGDFDRPHSSSCLPEMLPLLARPHKPVLLHPARWEWFEGALRRGRSQSRRFACAACDEGQLLYRWGCAQRRVAPMLFALLHRVAQKD